MKPQFRKALTEAGRRRSLNYWMLLREDHDKEGARNEGANDTSVDQEVRSQRDDDGANWGAVRYRETKSIDDHQ